MIAGCSDHPSTENNFKEATSSLDALSLDSVSTNDVIQDTLLSNDTIFIVRTFEKGFYQALYIEKNRQSIFYKQLKDFSMNAFDLEGYESEYEYFLKNKKCLAPSSFQSHLPINLLPVFVYQDDFYLYAPSDWGNARKRILTDSCFVFWYMDGPSPRPLCSYENNGNQHTFGYADMNNGKPVVSYFTVEQIDPDLDLYLFEFLDENEDSKYRYQLYTSVQSADKFDLIVNFSNPPMKWMEYDFDSIRPDMIPQK